MPICKYFHLIARYYAKSFRGTTKSLTADSLEALLQIQKTYPFCKGISKCLSNGKAPQHETDLFTHVRGLLYKHITDSGQKFLALVIPKSWKCDKYYPVFAPGTLRISPDTYLVPVSNGFGERHIKNATMGFINVTERGPLDDI